MNAQDRIRTKIILRADPGGTAIPGQPVVKLEQAPYLHPVAKISLISKFPLGNVSDIKLIRTDTTL